MTDYEIEDWFDHGDRVVEVYLDNEKVYTSVVSDEHIAGVRDEVAAMQVWLKYVTEADNR